MKQKVWKILSTQKEFTTTHEIVNELFKNRSLIEPEAITAFLNPSLQSINFDIGDIDAVITRIDKAIQNKEKIIVYGDYDADGVTSTAILWETLHHLGANATPYIPHREREGYGMSIYGIDYLLEKENPNLIITVDQGISARNQIAYAQSKDIEIIVTDHHTPPSLLPENCLIVHDHHVSGAGVAWKIATKLLQKHAEIKPNELPPLSIKLLELAAIGIICDLVPLQGESRILASYGIDQLRKSTRPGLIALAHQAKFDLSKADVYEIGFLIGPRINAMGRLEHAIDALRLLCTTNQERANDLADKIDLVNTDRKELTHTLINAARKQAEQQANQKILIIGDPSWNPGVIGLVASRMVEEFYVPTIVWGATPDNNVVYKASARSINGFNIINAIGNASEHLVSHGGHPMAAGLSLTPSSLDAFIHTIRQYAHPIITPELLTPSLTIDCLLPLPFANDELYQALQQLKPFGTQSQEPLFASRNLEVLECRAIGNNNKHLKLKVSQKEQTAKPFDAIAFNFGEYSAKIRPNTPIDLAYHIDLNEWNGKKNIQLKVRDIKITPDPQ